MKVDMKATEYYKSGLHKENVLKARDFATQKAHEMRNKRISEYQQNPKLCAECKKAIDYDLMRNKFCSKSCSATYNNRGKVKTEKTKEKISLSVSKTKGVKPNYINKLNKGFQLKLSLVFKKHVVPLSKICVFCGTGFFFKKKSYTILLNKLRR